MEVSTNIKPEKNYAISCLRLIAMTFIVLCHFFQYYNIELAWWLNVGVQMFFCISGFLYGNKKITSPINFISKNFKKILIPYFSFLIPTIILYYFFHKEALSKSSVISSLFTSGTIIGIEHLWFISYILFCYLITPYLQEIGNKIKKLQWPFFLCAFIVLTILSSILSYEFDSYFIFHRIFCYIFGYFAAIFLQNYKSNLFWVFTYILSSITIIMNLLRIYYEYINPRSSTLLNLFINYSHALLGISITFIFIISFRKIKWNALLDLSDKYSFYIYIVHQLFILSPFSLLTITNDTLLNWLITIISILLSAILLKLVSNIVEHYFLITFKFIKTKICI